MIEFDTLIKKPCIVDVTQDPVTCRPDPDTISGGGDDDDISPPVPPSDDDRCADPAFYDANPEICSGYPQLILKPEYSLIESGGTVQYKTYLRTGGNEQLLGSGLAYYPADPGVAIINPTTGLATGVVQGITTIGVIYGILNAYAQLEVVESCEETVLNFLLLIDNSQSASVGFNGAYASRLSYSKEAARRFSERVNLSKDKVGVSSFNVSGTIIQTPIQVLPTILSSISGISSTLNKTNLHDSIELATQHLDALSGRKVLVLFSDGENNEGEDPVPLANEWKDAGNIIVVVALRAWGTFFDTLYKISSDGFFLSAYNTTAATVIDTLIGIKSYICGGDCQPTPGTFPTAA